MGRPRTVTDEAIAEATREALREHGAGVSTEEIARRCGVSQPALFKRMGTREGLLVAALCHGPPRELDAFLARPPDPDAGFAGQLTDLLLQLHSVFSRVVPSLVWARATGLPMDRLFPEDDEPPPLRTRRAVTAWLKQAQRQGALRRGELATLAEQAIALVEARAFHEYLGGPGAPSDPVQRWARRSAAALLEGFGPR